jgi:hypothetical protein
MAIWRLDFAIDGKPAAEPGADWHARMLGLADGGR